MDHSSILPSPPPDTPIQCTGTDLENLFLPFRTPHYLGSAYTPPLIRVLAKTHDAFPWITDNNLIKKLIKRMDKRLGNDKEPYLSLISPTSD